MNVSKVRHINAHKKICSHSVGFKLYHDALGMPDTYRYLYLRLQIEQQRFTNFGVEAGLLFTDGVLCKTLQVNRSLLLAVLAEIKELLTNYATLNGKYKDLVPSEYAAENGNLEPGNELINLLCLTKPALAQDASIKNTKTKYLKALQRFSQSIAQTSRNLRTIVTEPRRLVWVKFDRESFEDLTTKIADLNAFLVSLLDNSQVTRLQDVVGKAYLEILQAHSDIRGLTDLVKALSPVDQKRKEYSHFTAEYERHIMLDSASRDQERDKATYQYLQKLVEIKIRYNQGYQVTGKDLTTSVLEAPELQLKLEEFDFPQSDSDDHGVDTRINIEYKGKTVWIEWKYSMFTDNVSSLDRQNTESRIQLLANLLCYEKPEQFRAQPCLGYVKAVENDGETQYGFVFERPPTIPSNLQLNTLHILLRTLPKPSLSDRIKLCMILARSLLNFHAVGWLHKGLRSDNIIIFSPPTPPSSPSKSINLTSPYVSGFDLARPGIIDSMTEKPYFDPAKDIYRHPYAQSIQSSGGYRRSYDLYSLGIIILEIAMWKRIENIIGLTNIERVKSPTLQEIQPWLLGRSHKPNTALPTISTEGQSCFDKLASECGDSLRSVVKHCLTMDEADKAQYDEEPESSIAVRVQRITQEDILGRLERMALVL